MCFLGGTILPTLCMEKIYCAIGLLLKIQKWHYTLAIGIFKGLYL
jgi:hypothetical protein